MSSESAVQKAALPKRVPVAYTPVDDIPGIHARVKEGFTSRRLRPVEYRKQQIAQLGYMLKDNHERFEDAFKADLGRHKNDCYLLELGTCHAAVLDALSNIHKWTRTQNTPFNLNYYFMSPKVRQEPKGVVLIIGPFNYPLYATVIPAIAALAAGNAVVIKPSESAMAVAGLLTELLPKYLDPELVAIVNGSVAETTKLLDLRWDHRSLRVGKVVSMAAAKYLTPVTMELGGKSPVFIDTSPSGKNLPLAARRILWGKIVNAGQTCMAPDYVLIQREFQDELIEEFRKAHEQMFPASEGGARGSESFSRIINESQFDRLEKLLDATKGEIVIGGEMEREDRYIAPTVVKDCTGEDSLMADEIFGPILPLVPVDSVEEALAFVNAREHPLSLMSYSSNPKFNEHIFDNTQSGACLANDALVHGGCMTLPFGGIGNSGHGNYLGHYGFRTFTHERAMVQSPSWLDVKFLYGLRFPPFKSSDLPFIRRLWRLNDLPYPRAGEAPSGLFGWVSKLFGK
ncbi:hypothetical protein FRB99_008310 [Tulasnella sp. 403]|nr:hypothetical protein FRB99_008310 [Tulasnella sp. 403]